VGVKVVAGPAEDLEVRLEDYDVVYWGESNCSSTGENAIRQVDHEVMWVDPKGRCH